MIVDYNLGSLKHFNEEIGHLNDKLLKIKDRYTFIDNMGKKYTKYPDYVKDSINYIHTNIYRLDSQVNRIIYFKLNSDD